MAAPRTAAVILPGLDGTAGHPSRQRTCGRHLRCRAQRARPHHGAADRGRPCSVRRVRMAGTRPRDAAHGRQPRAGLDLSDERLMTEPAVDGRGWYDTFGAEAVDDRVGCYIAVSYTHLRAHETVLDLVC